MRRSRSLPGVLLAVTCTAFWSAGSLDGATPVAQERELSPREQAIHALNRLGFGPRPGDVDRVLAMGVDRWIAQQLAPSRIRDAAGERAMAAFPLAGRTAHELYREFPPPGARIIRDRLRGDTIMSRADSMELRRQAQRSRQFVADLLASKVALAVVSERQLQEVMTDFWENHFNVFIGKSQVRYYLPEYTREAIRPHALGRFRDLLGAVAKSPAMLVYLDNAQSVADSGRPTLATVGRAQMRRGRGARLPVRRRGRGADSATMIVLQQRRPRGLNENYARELLELHTLGVDGGYTQQDVIEVARALTGWSITPVRQGRTGFVFRAAAHDAGEKVVLGHRLPAGRGIEDGEQVLDIVARHPSTARFIAHKLAVRFVSDSPPPALVERAAGTFTRTDGDIREVVRTIVTSPEFFSRAAWRSKVKSPFEVVVSSLRAIGAQADTSPLTAALVGRLGQPLYAHQAPNGWPETGSAWMNTGAILNRINFGQLLATGRLPGAPLTGWPAFASLERESRAAQVDAVIEHLLGGHVSPETREILVSGHNPLADAAAADTSLLELRDETRPVQAGRATRRPGRGMGRAGRFGRLPPVTGLPQIIGLAVGSPEFQRR